MIREELQKKSRDALKARDKETRSLLTSILGKASMALMFSSFSHTMGGAILTGIIGFVFFGIVAILPNTLGFHLGEQFVPYSLFGFTSQIYVPMYMMDELPTGMPIDSWFSPDIIRMMIICGIYFSIFFVISLIVVKKRDFVL